MAWLFEVRVWLLHSVYFVRTRQAPLRESNSYKRATSESCWKLQQTVCGCVYARNCALPSLGQLDRLISTISFENHGQRIWTASCQVGEQVINGVRRIMEVIVENALL